MLARVLLSLALLAGTAQALAQTYPNRPVRVIVAFAPGTTSDIIGRMFAERLSQSMGQPFVVENRTGAGGTIGAEAVARAPPDGYTLLDRRAAGQRARLPQSRYDTAKDFASVTVILALAPAARGEPRLPGAHGAASSSSTRRPTPAR
jgi:tripartite-type tricarboxylate transporter receptor subunit TctC